MDYLHDVVCMCVRVCACALCIALLVTFVSQTDTTLRTHTDSCNLFVVQDAASSVYFRWFAKFSERSVQPTSSISVRNLSPLSRLFPLRILDNLQPDLHPLSDLE